MFRLFSAKPALGVVEHFYRRKPEWFDVAAPTTSRGVAAFLSDLKGQRATSDVAQATGLSRFAIARWLKGEAEPRLPDFLRVLAALSLRLLDFLEGLVDPTALASVAEGWQRLQSARRTAYEAPWSHAVLRALEIESYKKLRRHTRGWIARQTGISVEQEELSLELLSAAGQIQKRARRWEVVESVLVDTRNDPGGAKRLREFWAQEALGRLMAQPQASFAYYLFSVSHADLERIRALHRSYFRDLRALRTCRATVAARRRLSSWRDPGCVRDHGLERGQTK